MTIKSPCYKCTDRFYNRETKKRCHNNCEKYARYHREREKLIAENQVRVQFNSYKYDNVPRLKRASVNKMFRSTRK